MKIKGFVLFGLVVSLAVVSAVAAALPITTDRVRIWQEGEEIFFALQVDDLPEEFEIDKESTRDNTIDYNYGIRFYDGESIYPCDAINFKFPSESPRSVPLTSFQQSLSKVEGRSTKVLTSLKCRIEEDWIVWTAGLPIVDRDGNEVEIHFEGITHIGLEISANDLGISERHSYEIGADGEVIDLGETSLFNIIAR